MNLATTPPTDYQQSGASGGADAAPAPSEGRMTDGDWVDMARWCHSDGTQWMEHALRAQWEKNIKLFKNQHPPGSKYLSADYKHRSRLFRPKVRSSVMKSEAAAAAAFFTTDDVVMLQAMDDNNPEQLASSEIWTEVLNYRLKVTVPWFRILIGAKQDSEVMGVCISRQDWDYTKAPDGRVIRDTPRITLIPGENIRCAPGADWIDPVNTSPYWIEKRPMFVGDVKTMMRSPPKEGQPAWRAVNDAVLIKARCGDFDVTRLAREGRSGDPKDQAATLREHDVVWIHFNYIRLEGVDWYYITAAEYALLTDPIPADQVNRLGDERPYVMGMSTIEAHRTHPASRVELLQDLQSEANEISNQRIDNVKLAMNGRYFVKTGKVVDLASLTRSVPGAATQMADPEHDVVWHRPSDVTASSYAEQDRINVDFDELAGSFSPSSVQSNRKLNETVGGMNLLAGSASGMAEYSLRIFANTWVEPVLRQLIKLEQAYETDLVLIGIAAQKRNLIQRFGINHITDELLAHSLTVQVNVGMAATNPDARLGKFLAAAKAVGELVGPMVLSRVKPDEVIKEIFGHAGYKDGARFFTPAPQGQDGQPQMPPHPPDPHVMMAQQRMHAHAAEGQQRMQLADQEAKARIARDDALAQHKMVRDRVADTAKHDQALVQAFGDAASQVAEAGAPTEQQTSLDRLKGFLDHAEQIGNAVQQMTRAIQTLAQGQARLMQGEQQIMARLDAGGRQIQGMQRQRQADGQRHQAGIDRIAAHIAAPRRLVKGADGRPGGVQVGNGPVRPIIYGTDGQPTGLG